MKRPVASYIGILICVLIAWTASIEAQWVENGTEICVHASNQQYCEIIPDGEGGAIITWDDDRLDGYDDIFTQRIDKYGNVLWTANGEVICDHSGIQIYPRLISDGEGGAIICWLDARDGPYLVYAQRIDANGDTLWNGDGVKTVTTIYSGWSNNIATDNAGGAIVVWTDMRTAEDHVYAQRLSANGDTLWNGSGVTVCPTAGTQNSPRIASDGSHGCFVTWWDGRGVNWDIYGQRINAAGGITWGAGYPVCTQTGDQRSPVIAYDGRGGAIMAWEDYRSTTNYDIYSGRIDTSGTYSWALAICTFAGDQNWIDIAPYGDGGAVMAWTDQRNGNYDIFAQAVDKNGAVLWTADGLGVCTAVSSQSNVRITSDGTGGALIVWYDYREGNGDIYCQKIDAGGNPLWSADGVAVCTDPAQQQIPVIAHDGEGGAIMSWLDQRTLWTDVYAMRVERNGYWGYPCPYVHEILDVPDDQGDRVTVKWNGTRLDEYPNQVVTHYSVWRSLDGPEAMALAGRDVPEIDLAMVGPDFEGPALRRTSLSGASYWWEWIANMDAHYLDNYSITAATLNDSMGTDENMHYFFLSAHTSDPFIFWDSPPDSGYSVDNLAPCTPMALTGEQSFAPEGLDISWDPNTEIDLSHYNVYRGLSDDFVPSPGNLLVCLSDTTTFDGEWRWDSGYYYKVSAVDIHGNESPFAGLGPDGVTGGDTPEVPLASYLSQNYPNPFNPVTTIRFGLSEPSFVSLRIYDAAGRTVRELVHGSREAGVYSETWDGRDSNGREVASGIYFYKLVAGNFSETRKMVLLR